MVGAIIPWNGPLTATIWKIGPAIATGCTVVLKPAEEAPLTSLRLGELCMEAGIPPGVVDVVPGYGETAGAALSSHSGVDKAATFGLGSGVWTTNVSKAHKIAKALRAGSVWVNCYQAMDPAAPFGGYKMSGYGRESGKQHVEEYLNVKAVWIKTA